MNVKTLGEVKTIGIPQILSSHKSQFRHLTSCEVLPHHLASIRFRDETAHPERRMFYVAAP